MQPDEFIKFRRADEKSIQILTTGECYYSSPENFNDPLDCAHSLEGFPQKILIDLESKLRKEKLGILHGLGSAISEKLRRIDYGVVSFCGRHEAMENQDPILCPNLWGHYAENHKGICIGFSPKNTYDTFDYSDALKPQSVENGRQFPVPTQPGGSNLLQHITTRPHIHENLLSSTNDRIIQVKYSDQFKLPTPNWDKVIENYENDETIINASSSSEMLSKLLNDSLDVKEVVSNKHKNWKNENEYRLFGNKNLSQMIGAEISSVTFGLNTPDNVVRYITSIIARFYGINSISLYKMTLISGGLSRVPFEINDAMLSSSQSSVTFQ